MLRQEKKGVNLCWFLYNHLHSRQHFLIHLSQSPFLSGYFKRSLLFFLLKDKYSTVFSRKNNLGFLEHLLEKSSSGISSAKNDLTSHRGILFMKTMIYFLNRCKLFIYDSAGIFGFFLFIFHEGGRNHTFSFLGFFFFFLYPAQHGWLLLWFKAF